MKEMPSPAMDASGVDLAPEIHTRPMRVLHVTSGNLYGGVEVILVTLAQARHLSPETEIHFGVCFEGRLTRELRATDVPLHVLGNVRASRPWTVVGARRRLRALLQRIDFDVVVCHMAWAQAIFGPVVRGRGLPLVYYLHNRTEGRHWIERWARIAVTPDLVLCVSQDTARTCPNLYPGVNSQVFYSPLPLKAKRALQDEPRAVRAELETPSDATVIIQVSRMEAWKGQSSLLKALGRLKDRRDWMCWMVGGVQTAAEVAYAQSLRDLADGLGIAGRVKFLGERSDVARLLAASDVFCQPNRSTEGFSIVFMEAFLASLPIVTTAIGGALEMVDDSCGVLVPLNDEDVLTAALQRLIDTPNLRTLLGGRGYRRVHEMCDPETQLRKLNGILAALIERKTRNS